MATDLQALFALCKDPMLLVSDNRISALNAEAQKLFPQASPGKSAVGLLPDHLLAWESESFVANAVMGGVSYTVSALETESGRVFSLRAAPKDADASDILSDTLLSSLLSTLFNVGLSLDLLSPLVDTKKDKKAEQYLSITQHNYYSLQRLLGNLNTAAAMRRNDIPFSPRQVDLAALCSAFASTVEPLAREKGIRLEFSTPIGQLFAPVDPEKIERVLFNLMANSLEHTPSGGRIRLGISQMGNRVLLSVDDTGSGISEEKLRDIFTRFEARSHTLAGSGCSSGGLGLDICRHLVEMHGGALIIESREGEGASVRVLLPTDTKGSATLANPGLEPAAPSMAMVLTELSGVLSRRDYEKKYLD